MPASERSFGDPLPTLLYPDTDFLSAFLFAEEPLHGRALGFMQRLQRWAGLTLVVSSLLWTEFAQALAKEHFRLRLTSVAAIDAAPIYWGSASARTRYLQRHLGALELTLNQFDWIEVPLDRAIRRAAVDLMARYALKSQDAVHATTVFAAGARDLVSFDAAYRRVDGLALWNDRVHGRAATP